MTPNQAFFSGLGTGAGLMLLLDPSRGARRRALVRDKLSRSVHATGEAVGTATRDLRHRAQGVTARLRRRGRDERVDDDVLLERVRATMGRHVSHPRAIDATVRAGVVTLAGPILSADTPGLLAAVRRVRGVRDVVNILAEHDDPGSVPALQGGVRHRRSSMLRWVPATRLLTGAGGTAFALYGLRRLADARSTRRMHQPHW
jgi:hypothetical protein